ncbi:MAG: protease, partial [Pseudomonadota bacterium]
SGDDTLVDGADTASLYGGSGDDTLTGGAGRDYFIFDDRRGDNVITDFEDGSDRILMTAASYSFADLTITDAGGDALIDVAGIAISVRLLGVDADLIDAFDFGF